MGRGRLKTQKHHWAGGLTWLSIPPHLASTSLLLSPSSYFHPLSVAFSPADSPSHHPEIRRLFPRAQMQTVPNASHWVHSDCPQDFMAAVRDFLA